jgi:hypothetical protein
MAKSRIPLTARPLCRAPRVETMGGLAVQWPLLLLAFGCDEPPLEDFIIPPPITYHQDVAPILARRCVSCHQQGSIAEFMPLTTYEQVRAASIQIMDAVRSKRMPPSVVDVSGTCGDFRDARQLTPDELATILQWGSTTERRAGIETVAGPPSLPRIDRLDRTLAMAEPYEPDASLSDDYRCFVIDPGLDRDTFLTAYQVVPGEPRSVHHVILFALASEEADTDALALDAADPGPGYRCFGGPGASDFRFLAAWAPGTGATRFPDGTGLVMYGGRKTVLQVHYNLAEGAAPDQTRIEMQLENEVADEAIVLPLADLELEIQPGLREVSTTIEATVGEDQRYTILGAFPHMHRLGRSLRVERLSDFADSNVCVLDVPNWNFEWQEFFFYQEPMLFVPGDRVRLTCTYDTTSRSEPVRWGEGTEDEMCLVGFYVLQR